MLLDNDADPVLSVATVRRVGHAEVAEEFTISAKYSGAVAR